MAKHPLYLIFGVVGAGVLASGIINLTPAFNECSGNRIQVSYGPNRFASMAIARRASTALNCDFAVYSAPDRSGNYVVHGDTPGGRENGCSEEVVEKLDRAGLKCYTLSY